jgi:hypothetical protein
VREERSRQYREQSEREKHERLRAGITEFGGKKKKPPWLNPADEDPTRDKAKVALAEEILLLRGAMARLHEAIEITQAGLPFGLVRPGPYGKPRHKKEEASDPNFAENI